MNHAARIVAIVGVLSAFALTVSVRAQHSDATERPARATPRDGVLLLKNGHILTGRITWSGDHYFVDRGGLQMGVRAAEVAATAADLDDAYRQQREKLARDDLDGHQSLAQWCLRHELLGYAATELSDCMALHPRNGRTESLLRQLQSAVRIAESNKSSKRIDDANADADADDRERRDPSAANSPAVEDPGVESTADAADELPRSDDDPYDALSDDTIETFVTKIQPLLINRCANGGCHGGASSAKLQFQRFDPRKSPSRVYTERNRAAALRFVDRARPEDSPLLVAPSGPHGSAKIAIFEGRTLGHRAELAAWIRLAARDANRSQPGAKSEQHAKPARHDAAFDPSSAAAAAYDAALPRGRQTSGAPKPPAVDRSQSFPNANPHDPDVFNRRFFPDGVPPKRSRAAEREVDTVSRDQPGAPPQSRTDPRPTSPGQKRPSPQRRSVGEDDIPPFQSLEESEVAAEQSR